MSEYNEESFQQIAKTYQGLEQLLAEEIRELGGENIEILKRAVSYSGSNDLMYKVNLYSRVALAVLVPIESFLAEDPEELYRKATRIEWDRFFRAENTFAINASIHSPYFTHSQFAALKMKDAIVDYFRKKTGKRPSVDRDEPEFRINLHIYNKEVTIGFDSSGEALFKRGYRQRQSEAPLNELLAAGMILLSGWRGEKTFIDPMCGSGTLPIEAAMISMNIPGGWYRRKFGFMNWPDFDKNRWLAIRDEAQQNIKKQSDHLIIGSDILPENIEKSKRNAHLIRCNNLRFACRDFFDFERPDNEPALIMINPPYGERLESETNLNAFYKHMGDELKQKFRDCEAWVISSNLEALKKIGLKAGKKHTLFNGPLECKFTQYELYEGSKREIKTPEEDS